MSSELSVSVNGERRTVDRGTPVREVLNGIPSRDLVAAKVNDKVVDLSRTLESDATVEPVLADSPGGLDVIRHSTAHLMAMAVQQLYPGTQVTIGPVIEDGF
jgi:threonyl-tRNA synthetase